MQRGMGRAWTSLGCVAALAAGCTDPPAAPTRAGLTPAVVEAEGSVSSTAITPDSVRRLAAGRGITPLVPPAPIRPALVRLGQALLFDPILSGNRDIACSTCHLPSHGLGDGKSLSVGQGGTGFGPGRVHSAGVFIPRNAPPLFNLGAMQNLFWDGRIEFGREGAVRTPAKAQITPAMRRVFEFGPISAIGMFPVTNRAEMRADRGNELADEPDSNATGIWIALMRRLGAVPEYRQMFEAAYPGTPFGAMTFAHASNAIGGFVLGRFTFVDSPWDRFLAGNDAALTPRQLEGAQTFLTLKCSICHGGPTFSDQKFHNVAVAQIGPGSGNGEGKNDDFGRMNVTGLRTDRYLFRTTPLRNVELTGPYGHDGAIVGLRDFIEHCSESDKKLLAYDPEQLEPALRFTVVPNKMAILATRDTLLNGVVLTSDLVEKLFDYMKALTDAGARDLDHFIPTRLPSGLPVGRP